MAEGPTKQSCRLHSGNARSSAGPVTLPKKCSKGVAMMQPKNILFTMSDEDRNLTPYKTEAPSRTRASSESGLQQKARQ
jgi:hypothetical protein